MCYGVHTRNTAIEKAHNMKWCTERYSLQKLIRSMSERFYKVHYILRV